MHNHNAPPPPSPQPLASVTWQTVNAISTHLPSMQEQWGPQPVKLVRVFLIGEGDHTTDLLKTVHLITAKTDNNQNKTGH